MELMKQKKYNNWKELYPKAEEMIPDRKNRLEYLGPPVRIIFLKIIIMLMIQLQGDQ